MKALERACFKGNINRVQKLIANKGAHDWNRGFFGACDRGHLEIVKLMIEKGADNWNGGLRAACDRGHLEIVKLLIETGANDWDLGLWWACYGGHFDIMQLMVAHGAKPHCSKIHTQFLERQHLLTAIMNYLIPGSQSLAAGLVLKSL